jgi:transcriptional regulator with XRE-family HTH domain
VLPFLHSPKVSGNITLKPQRPRRHKEPDECNTLGEHVRNRRLKRRETQRIVAQQLNVETDSITNWELGRNEPQVHHIPLIIEYLGYTPLFDLAGTNIEKRVQQTLYSHGISQKELARKLNIDPATISRIVEEKGNRVLKKTKKKIRHLLT